MYFVSVHPQFENLSHLSHEISRHQCSLLNNVIPICDTLPQPMWSNSKLAIYLVIEQFSAIDTGIIDPPPHGIHNELLSKCDCCLSTGQLPLLLQIISEGCIIVRIDPQSNLWEIRLIVNVKSIQRMLNRSIRISSHSL